MKEIDVSGALAEANGFLLLVDAASSPAGVRLTLSNPDGFGQVPLSYSFSFLFLVYLTRRRPSHRSTPPTERYQPFSPRYTRRPYISPTAHVTADSSAAAFPSKSS